MANRYMTQFFYTLHKMPVLIDCNVVIGGTGAVGTLKGPGVASVTRLAAGTYKILFQDNYYKFYGMTSSFLAPVSGSNVTAGSFVTGTTYVITAIGTTNWQLIGVPTGITAAAGVSFVATGAGTGTGTAKIVTNSGIVDVQAVGNPSLQLGPQPSSNQGGYIIVQCLGATDASTTTLIPTDPVSGSVMQLSFYLSNSSVTVQGE